MSARYGKATFTGGEEAYLVYQDSPGWVLPALFKTLDEASDWVNQGYPSLPRTQHEQTEIAKFSEEPVHIIADLDYPDKPGLRFYTTASLADLVITGPTSKENAESVISDDDIYTKEFFDSWRPKVDTRSVDSYGKLAPDGKALIDSILAWWVTAQFKTRGERGSYNVFDRDPDFITMAKLIRSPEAPALSWHTGTVTEIAASSLSWWRTFNNDDDGRPIFYNDPEFISLAKPLAKKAKSYDLEP